MTGHQPELIVSKNLSCLSGSGSYSSVHRKSLTCGYENLTFQVVNAIRYPLRSSIYQEILKGQTFITPGKRSLTKPGQTANISWTALPGVRAQLPDRPRAEVRKSSTLPSDGRSKGSKSRGSNLKKCFFTLPKSLRLLRRAGH